MTRTFDETALLLVMAMPAEAARAFDDVRAAVVFTGVGKVNATYALTRELARLQARGQSPSLVVNFGTAGSRRFATGSLVACNRFMQIDMDARPLGFDLGQTPFEEGPSVIECEAVFSALPEAMCSSADRFDVGLGGEAPRDVVEMEAYALSKVCLREAVPFACAKYISDGADHGAATDWVSSLPLAARSFRALYDQLTRRS